LKLHFFLPFFNHIKTLGMAVEAENGMSGEMGDRSKQLAGSFHVTPL